MTGPPPAPHPDLGDRRSGEWRAAVVASVLSGAFGFAMLLGFSLLLHRVYPYPTGSTPAHVEAVWAIHVTAEKLFNSVILAVCAFAAAFPVRRRWKVGLSAAIGSGLVFQVIAIGVYLARFGLDAYLEHSRFGLTLGSTLATSSLFGFPTVWRSYRRRG